MKIFYTVPPDQAHALDTSGLRSRFHIDTLFVSGEISCVYVLEDRMLIFVAAPRFKFDVPPDDVVMHFMGEPGESRHLVVHDQQAVISPNWSLHGAAGSASYRFIWAMAGENQNFTDMDHITLADLS
jgi:5-keto 4-deoxyuronate isomerase